MTDEPGTLVYKHIIEDVVRERDRYERQAAWQRRQMSILRDDMKGRQTFSARRLEARLDAIIHGAPDDEQPETEDA